jgi:hypothetical protein
MLMPYRMPLSWLKSALVNGKLVDSAPGAHVAPDLQLVNHLRDGAVQALLLLRAGRFAVNQLLAEHRFNFVGHELQLFQAGGVDRKVQTEAEEAFLADLQLIAHLLGIYNGRCLPGSRMRPFSASI